MISVKEKGFVFVRVRRVFVCLFVDWFVSSYFRFFLLILSWFLAVFSLLISLCLVVLFVYLLICVLVSSLFMLVSWLLLW